MTEMPSAKAVAVNATARVEVPLALEAASLRLACDRMTGVEAAARVMYHLGRGEVMTPAFVSTMTGLSRSHASHLLAEMSRVVPIYSDDGHWSISPP